MKRRVVKLGGSLLTLENAGTMFHQWLRDNGDMQNVVVVGGGEMANAVRRMHRLLDDQQSHQMACRAMRLNAEMVAFSISDAAICDRMDELVACDNPVVFFQSDKWILGCEDVPKSWDFTSDSIAAKLAAEIDADELVLLKSRIGELSEPGFVDACFAKESKSVKSIRVSTLHE